MGKSNQKGRRKPSTVQKRRRQQGRREGRKENKSSKKGVARKNNLETFGPRGAKPKEEKTNTAEPNRPKQDKRRPEARKSDKGTCEQEVMDQRKNKVGGQEESQLRCGSVEEDITKVKG